MLIVCAPACVLISDPCSGVPKMSQTTQRRSAHAISLISEGAISTSLCNQYPSGSGSRRAPGVFRGGPSVFRVETGESRARPETRSGAC